MNINDRIRELKEQKDVVILAHYYVPGDVQAIADFTGDSYALAKKAAQVAQKNILFAGVFFMGESAKLLNPQKHVYMVDRNADCQMARMINAEQVRKVKAEHPEAGVVCYVNSTAETKAVCDVCVTSSNAVKVVSKMEQKEIYFVPDQNLGRVVANELPEKDFIFHNGYCPIHQAVTRESILQAKKEHPQALVLMHPECSKEVLELADYAGSTAGIIQYAGQSESSEFIIVTECGVFYQLEKENPDKHFYALNPCQVCPDMKLATLEQVLNVLENLDEQEEILLDDSIMEQAKLPLQRMLELAQ